MTEIVPAAEPPDPALDAETIVEAFDANAAATPDSPALQAFGDHRVITWAEYAQRSRVLARGLDQLGLAHEDVIAVLLTNRPEFNLIDTAALRLGCATFSIYATSAPEQVEHQLDHSRARAVVTERRFLAMIGPLASTRGLELLVVDEAPLPSNLHALRDDAAALDLHLEAKIQPDDVACLIYTSGTTGPPKAIELTHRSVLAMVRGVDALSPKPPWLRLISYLPAAHIVDRATHYAHLIGGGFVTTVDDLARVSEALGTVSPTMFIGVPRVWEKMRAGVEAGIAAKPPAVGRAVAAAVDRVRHLKPGEAVPAELEEAQRRAEDEIFRPLRKRLGLDAVRRAFIGGAPGSPDLIAFFNAIGVPLVEVWGMSETSGISTINPPGANRIGSVGCPVPGLELRLASDGELLVRGPMVVRGYRDDPVRTAEAVTADGWLRTGDLAAIDAAGYVTITGRKKELIINAAGKNMSPDNIEAAIKGEASLIGHVCAVGDGRPYLVALVVADPEATTGMAAEAVSDAIAAAIDRANRRLSRVEQIKRFALVPPDAWVVGGEYLTPTMKLRRSQIARDYAAVIDELYAAPPA